MDNFFKGLKEKISRKYARIAVVGLGYVGLPLALEFARKGFSVLGIEIDRDRLSHLKKRESYISDISSRQLRAVLKMGRFSATADFGALSNIDVVIICVPTPLKRKYHPNISYIKEAVKSIAKNIKKPSLIILESTTYPGTTEEVILPLLEAYGLRHGEDFYLSFSPERIDPGNIMYPVHKIPKVVGGISKEAADLAVLVYRNIVNKVVPVSSARVAEFVKLLENTYRLINIGLIDELAMMAHKMNINIWEVVGAAKTKPFGFMPFYPGPGVGGHCLDKNETLYVKDRNSLKIIPMEDFIKYSQNIKGHDIEVLSFDPLRKRSVFRKVIAASARPYTGRMLNILTEDGRSIKVTDLHPMFTYNNSKWQLKYARDLQRGDCLPISLGLPRFSNQRNYDIQIDFIDHLWQKGQDLIEKIRVRPLDFSWKDYAGQIKHILRKQNGGKIPDMAWDYLSDNVLPLKYFYALEEVAKIDHSRLKLVTGRGPSRQEVPAKIAIDNDFC
ncbi:MAG: nucleotide sugar dehydrogenase [Candidatus Omnitrophica bacterium]|nr:nucleotide sugar dehydrogenase [Candidatus Omnitrophota bacterium]